MRGENSPCGMSSSTTLQCLRQESNLARELRTLAPESVRTEAKDDGLPARNRTWVAGFVDRQVSTTGEKERKREVSNPTPVGGVRTVFETGLADVREDVPRALHAAWLRASFSSLRDGGRRGNRTLCAELFRLPLYH